LQIDLYFIALQREGGKIAWVGVAWVGVSEALMTDQTWILCAAPWIWACFTRLHAKRGVSQRAKGFEIGICLP
jgi:hypothetical protein